MNKTVNHGLWSSRWMFVLAATGSAVGLGNIWRFPYVTGENGGGAFVLVYLACVILVGLPVMICEVMLGRRARLSPMNALSKIADDEVVSRNWRFLGLLGILAGFLILSFYSVVAGWSLAYTFFFFGGSLNSVDVSQAESFLNRLTGSSSTLLFWHSLFMVATVYIVARGVKNGLELAVKLLTPALFIMLFALVCYAGIFGNFLEALEYLFKPDFSALTGDAILVALGQAFFSLSLGMGALMVYGAYLPRSASIIQTSIIIAFADTLVAVLAGLAIFPIVFFYGLEVGQGPGLVFVTLTVGFGSMPHGQLFGLVFFLLLSIAAWTSAISLLEPIVAWLVETTGIRRGRVAALAGFGAWGLGICSLLSFNHWSEVKVFGRTFFELSEFLSTSIMLPLGGMLIVFFVGWKIALKNVLDELDISSKSRQLPVLLLLVKVVAPLGVALVLIKSSGIGLIIDRLAKLVF